MCWPPLRCGACRYCHFLSGRISATARRALIRSIAEEDFLFASQSLLLSIYYLFSPVAIVVFIFIYTLFSCFNLHFQCTAILEQTHWWFYIFLFFLLHSLKFFFSISNGSLNPPNGEGSIDGNLGCYLFTLFSLSLSSCLFY